MENDIDFVVTWVDGSDPNWIKEKNKFLGIKRSNDNVGIQRYRDWNLMRYWFRGVEKFAPWIHKIFFVTCGQKPEWLNLNHPKLVFVKHEEYMPSDKLPTFNSNAIEIGIHRIEGLSEQFVQFNDDFFPIKQLKKEDFFVDTLPCDYAALDVLTPNGDFEYLRMNNMLVINQYFSKQDVISKNRKKWINLKDKKSLLRTLELLYPWPTFSAIRDFHGPISFTKTDFDIVWNLVPEIMEETQGHRFRSKEDHTAWLVRYWRLMEGRFHVCSQQHFGYIPLINDCCENICKVIESQKKKILCINDEYKGDNFKQIREKIVGSFEKILPEKSSYEL